MSGSAAPKNSPAAAPESPSTSAQAVGALRNIVIAAVVLGAIFVSYAQYAKHSDELKKLRTKIAELLKHDTTHDYREAVILLDKGLTIRPSDPYFVSTRAEASAILWVEDGDEDQKKNAEDYTAQSVSNSINTGARFSAETITLIGEGKIDEADSKLNVLVQKGVTTPQIIGAIGEVHLRQGALDKAKNDFKQIQDMSSRYAAFYGESLFLNGELPAAQSVLAREAQNSPNHMRVRIDRARVDIARGDRLVEAAKTFSELLPEKGPPNADLSSAMKSRVLAGKAELALALGNPAAAEPLAKAAVDSGWKLDPEVALAQFDLGMALALQKKAGALDAFKASIQQFPYMPRVYFQGALALAREDKAADGESLFKMFKDKGLKQDDAYFIARGDFLVATGKQDEAGVAYDEAIKASKNFNPEALYKKGLVVQTKAADESGPAKLKTLNEAMDLYTKAIGLRERYPEAWRQQGIIYADNGDPKAQEKFLKAYQYFVEAKVSKATLSDFMSDTLKRITKAGPKFRAFAKDWKAEMDKLK